MSQRDVAKGKFAEKRAKAMRKNNCINMLLKIYTTVAPSHLYENYKSTPKMLVTKQIWKGFSKMRSFCTKVWL